MSRIPTPATIEDAPAAAHASLNGVKAALGIVPNLYRLTANSPAALEGLLSLSGALGKGKLPAATRERIALAIANVNGCSYCNSAHSYIAANMLKLPEDEIILARGGRASEAKTDAAVALARKVAIARGELKDTDISAARAAGLSDGELVEIVGHVALNVFTNYLNEVFATEIDFPVVTAERVAEPA
jgi:uncharacterized peroxidase-related enzyme